MSLCLVCNEECSIKTTGTNWLASPETGEVGVCDVCLADARLGRLVRGMPKGSQLVVDSDEKGPYWYAMGHVPNSFRFEATPEEALEKAGVKENSI